MAVRDHTGRARPSFPLDGTFTSFAGNRRFAGGEALCAGCQRSLTAAEGFT